MTIIPLDSLLWVCAALGKEFEGGESPDTEPAAQCSVSISIHLCYEHVNRILKGLAHLFVGWSKAFTVTTPCEGEGGV